MTRPCLTPGCHRVPAPDYARCPECTRRLLEPVPVRRMGARPLPEITESELRLLWGDR